MSEAFGCHPDARNEGLLSTEALTLISLSPTPSLMLERYEVRSWYMTNLEPSATPSSAGALTLRPGGATCRPKRRTGLGWCGLALAECRVAWIGIRSAASASTSPPNVGFSPTIETTTSSLRTPWFYYISYNRASSGHLPVPSVVFAAAISVVTGYVLVRHLRVSVICQTRLLHDESRFVLRLRLGRRVRPGPS
jgi:hypothetical protein